MTESRELKDYRDLLLGVTERNTATLMNDPRWTEKEKAGTALLLAVHQVGVAAAYLGKVEPHMQNAPVEAQIDNVLDLLRETLCKKKPQLHVVGDEGEGQ